MSARAVREAEDFDELEEPWLITPGLPDERRKASSMGVSPAVGILLLVLVIFVVLVAPPWDHPGPAPRQLRKSRSVVAMLKKIVPGVPSFDVRTDFRSGLGDWVGNLGNKADGWAAVAGKIRLGRLRLWKPTLSMGNYQMVFQGQIESKAMGWAFRASDMDNYYAAKIAVPGPGGPPRPEIIRYSVVGGQKEGVVKLPLPVAIEAHKPYKVRVQVKDDRFSTTINGQVVDTWTDQRHRKGGVGFFSDPGELALISWVRVNDADGLVSRLFSFSLLVGPSGLMGGPTGGF